MDYRFNTDILLGDDDRLAAARRFPAIAFALDHKRLREIFAPIDARANLSKARSRRWGIAAVLLAAAALMVAAGEVLLVGVDKSVVRLIAGLAALAGIASVLIGVFGVMFRQRKMRWLADRYATERLRQFHFQYYGAHARSIVAASNDPVARADFLARRDAAFEMFRKDVIEEAVHRLEALISDERPGQGILFEAEPPPENSPALEEYFAAFEVLRLQRQINYCELILKKRGGRWRYAPVKQSQTFKAIAMACVFLILLLHGLVLIGAFADIKWMKSPPVHVGAVWAAIIALAVRTLEEGFQPEIEIDRMEQYRASLKDLHARFRAAASPAEKLLVMRDLEGLTFQEMTQFLKTNHAAVFVM